MIKNKINLTTIQHLVLSKYVYPKPVLRYKNKKAIGQLDYSFSIFNTNLKNLENIKVGQNCLYPLKTLIHKNNNVLKIQTPLPFQVLNKPYEIASNLNLVANKISKDNFNGFITLLNPLKGGYYAYYSGIHGFIPKKQLKQLVSQSINLTTKNLTNIIYFSKSHKYSALIKPRILVKAIKLKISQNNKMSNLANFKKLKMWKNRTTFIFFSTEKEEKEIIETV
jgi:hypothetical protein